MLRDLLENGNIMQIIATFIALALIVALFLCLVFIIVGGITFILSAGNEEKIKKAIHTIRFAIIGLFVTFIAFFAVSWTSRLLDIPFQLSFSTIVQLMQEIFSALGNA
jgi:ABC-type Fe3+ transport system permease subunit